MNLKLSKKIYKLKESENLKLPKIIKTSRFLKSRGVYFNALFWLIF